VIDPLRKRQNDRLARALIDLQRAMAADSPDLRAYAEKWRPVVHAQIHNWPLPPALDVDFLAPQKSFDFAAGLIEASIDPLREAFSSDGPVAFDFRDQIFEFAEVSDYVRPDTAQTQDERVVLTLDPAPLMSRVCPELLSRVSELQMLVFDPTSAKPLAVERAYYARERVKLIWWERWLWQSAALYGGPSDVIPYANRLLLLAFAWHPVAHRAPGASTICVRCGVDIFRKGERFRNLPRCSECMKESPAQRVWPAHAMAPHRRGTWALRCQDPDCWNAFEGPRHQKFCHRHRSSRLTRSRRRTASQPSETGN